MNKKTPIMNKLPTDDSVIDDLLALYEFHLDKVRKYKKMLGVANIRVSEESPVVNNDIIIDPVLIRDIEHKKTSSKKAEKTPNTQKQTFIGFISLLFKDGVPRNIHQIMEAYKDFSSKQYERKNFASRLSVLKKRGLIKMDTLKINQKIEYLWGNASWFENGKLKEEYRTIAKNKII